MTIFPEDDPELYGDFLRLEWEATSDPEEHQINDWNIHQDHEERNPEEEESDDVSECDCLPHSFNHALCELDPERCNVH